MSSSIFRVAIGIQGGAGLVHEQHLGVHGERAGDAEALLLAPGEPDAGGGEAVGDLIPEAGAAQRRLDAVGRAPRGLWR